MHTITELVKMMGDEYTDALHYAETACTHREAAPECAKLMMDLSQQEMAHAEKLRTMAAAELDKMRKDEPVEYAKGIMVLETANELLEDRVERVKHLHDKYNGK